MTGPVEEAHAEACRTVFADVRKTKAAQILANGAVAALLLAWPFEVGYCMGVLDV